MKSWKAIIAVTALVLGLTTLSHGLVTRYEFDMGGLSQDEAFSAMCLQGIENRNGPYMYYFISNHPSIYGPHYSHLWAGADTAWQNWYKSPRYGYSFTPIASFSDLLNLCKNDVNSNLVVYDPQVAGEEAVAATYAGVNTCLPVSGAVLNRTAPASKKMIGWVEENFSSIDAWRIMRWKGCPPPRRDTSLVQPGGDGESGFWGLPSTTGDELRLWGSSTIAGVAAWLYGAKIDTTKYSKVLIRVDSLSQGTNVVVKLVTIANKNVKVYEFKNNGSYITQAGVYTLSADSLPRPGEEQWYFEIHAFGCVNKIAKIDWVTSADSLGVRPRRHFVNEEFSDTLYWRASPGHATQTIYTRGNLSQALKLTTNVNPPNDSGWTTNAGDTVDLDIFPKIQIKVDSLSASGAQWKLTAKNGSTEYILQNWTTQAGGAYTYNLKTITGLMGKKVFDFKIKLKKTTSGAKVGVFNWLRSLPSRLDEAGWTVAKDLRDSVNVAKQRKFPMQEWAKNNLLGSTVGHHLAMSGNDGLNTYVGVDYLVQKQGYVFRLNNAKWTPDNEHALMGDILNPLYVGTEPVAVYGYMDNDDNHNDEWSYFQFLTQHGSYGMVTPAPNLSFHSKVPGSIPSQRHKAPLTLEPDKNYVALMLSEGDTPKFAFSFFGGSWKRDTAKGKIPFNWGINPVFAEVCPSILEYYYSNNDTANNYFFAGCSGVGATLPYFFPDTVKLKDYANLFKRVSEPADIPIADVWCADLAPDNPPPYNNIKIGVYGRTADNVKGFTEMQEYRSGPNLLPHIPWGHVSFVRDTVPVIRVFKNLYYWRARYDSIALHNGWVRASWDTTLSPAMEQAAWDTICSSGGDTTWLTKLSKWQMVCAERCTLEARRHKAPYFMCLFNDPLPDSQVVTEARGVKTKLDNIAPGKFVFVTLEQMMDLAKKARLLGSVEINHNAKFTNCLTCTLHLWAYADSMQLWDEDTTTAWMLFKGESDMLWTFRSNGVHWINVKYKVGHDYTNIFRDSIIVDTEAPYAEISSPTSGQMVSGMVPFDGYANDWFQHHLSLWEIYQDANAWCYDSVEVGMTWPIQMPGHFGDWNSTVWPNGYYQHSLMVNDSAGNISQDTVTVYVNNSGGGDGFASGFGTSTSIPMNLATDASGNVYIAETQGNRIRKHAPNKDSLFAFSTRRNNDTSGTTWPAAIALKDTSVLWIADGLNDCIKKFDRQGNFLLRFGSHGSDSGHFNQPCGIALDWKGRLWIVDRLNHRIQVYDTTGSFLFGFGGLGSDSGKLNSPTGIAITKDRLVYITDTKNHQLQVFDSLGNWKKTLKHPDSLGFDTPTGICTDKHGDIFIADTKHHRIVELNPYGKRLFSFGEQGDSLWQFRNPVGVTSSPGGHYLYVADMGNKRVTRFWVIRGDTLGGGGPQGGAGVQVLPLVYDLGPAIPNPSRGQTTFRYALPKESRVNMTFYNVAGQVVKELNQGKQKAGYYSLTWDGRNNQGHKVGPGVYFYRLQAGSWVKTRKMVVVR